MLQNFYPYLCPYFVIKAKPSLLTRTKSLSREQTSTLLSTTCQEKINFDPCILILLYLTLKLADFKQHRTQSIYTAHSSVLVFFISSFRKSTRHLGVCWKIMLTCVKARFASAKQIWLYYTAQFLVQRLGERICSLAPPLHQKFVDFVYNQT